MPVFDEHVIPAAILGQSIGRSDVVVAARKSMAFAAGIGSNREAYFNDGAIAPPAFIVSLEWALLNGEIYRSLLGAPQAVMERAVHLTQASNFYRSILAEDRVETNGRIAGLRQARRGVVVAVALETKDMAGTTLAASTFVALILGSKLDTPSQPISRVDEPEQKVRNDESGVLAVPMGTAHVYSECSGIWNPIHTEPLAARRAGFPIPIVHGTWTWASAMEWAIDQWCGGDPSQLRSWIGRFVSPVIPRSTMEFTGDTLDDTIRLSAGQDGKECLLASGTIGPA